MRANALVLCAAILSVALSGCVTSIFVDTTLTTREFACEALSEGHKPSLVIEARVDERTDLSPLDALAALRNAIADVGYRSPDSIEVRIVPVEDAPDVWDADAWSLELADHDGRQGLRTLHMVVYWVHDLPGTTTGMMLEPGVFAIDEGGLETKAGATGRPLQSVAVAALLHHAGHALGATNQGIPMQANHEGQPGHDADVASVMHHSLHHGADPTWAGVTYSNYTAALQADWAAAINDSLVCP